MRGAGSVAACATLLALATAGGCDSLPAIGRPPVDGTHSSTARWPYWPQRMRVHPLSRTVVGADGRVVLEVRIEFRDPDGIPTRALGLLTIDLLDADSSRMPLLEWETPILREDDNRERYDDVTRTYLLRLDVPRDTLPAHPIVRVRFDAADGLLFEDLAPIAGIE